MAVRGGEPQDMIVLEYDIYFDTVEPAASDESFQSFLADMRTELQGEGAPDGTAVTEIESEDTIDALQDRLPDDRAVILLGPDFAYVMRDSIQRLYDFRQNRTLTFDPDRSTFRNENAYALVYRDILTVRELTENGSRSAIPFGPDFSLDAFWLESAMGWSARENAAGLKISRSDDGLFSATFNNIDVFRLREDPVLTEDDEDSAVTLSSAQATSFKKLAAHHLPIHPEIMDKWDIGAVPPSRMTLTSRSPTQPEGHGEIWQLRPGAKAGYFKLPFPDGLSPEEKHPWAKEALNEIRANPLGAPKKAAETYIQETQDFLGSGNLVMAWMTGREYVQRTGDCLDTQDHPDMCALIDETQSHGAYNAAFRNFIVAWLGLAGEQSDRSIQELAYWMRNNDVPTLIKHRMAVHLSELSAAKRTELGVDDFDPDIMLKEAALEAPASPQIYIDLAKSFADNGDYIRAWDMYDFMRTVLPARGKLKNPAADTESQIEELAPDHF